MLRSRRQIERGMLALVGNKCRGVSVVEVGEVWVPKEKQRRDAL